MLSVAAKVYDPLKLWTTNLFNMIHSWISSTTFCIYLKSISKPYSTLPILGNIISNGKPIENLDCLDMFDKNMNCLQKVKSIVRNLMTTFLILFKSEILHLAMHVLFNLD